MNETLNLTLSTNPLFLLAVGGVVWTIMFGLLIGATRKVSKDALRGMYALSRDIQTKDFSYKPEFDKHNGGLKIAPYAYSSIFEPRNIYV